MRLLQHHAGDLVVADGSFQFAQVGEADGPISRSSIPALGDLVSRALLQLRQDRFSARIVRNQLDQMLRIRDRRRQIAAIAFKGDQCLQDLAVRWTPLVCL